MRCQWSSWAAYYLTGTITKVSQFYTNDLRLVILSVSKQHWSVTTRSAAARTSLCQDSFQMAGIRLCTEIHSAAGPYDMTNTGNNFSSPHCCHSWCVQCCLHCFTKRSPGTFFTVRIHQTFRKLQVSLNQNLSWAITSLPLSPKRSLDVIHPQPTRRLA